MIRKKKIGFLNLFLAYLCKAITLITHSLGRPPMGMGYEGFDCIRPWKETGA